MPTCPWASGWRLDLNLSHTMWTYINASGAASPHFAPTFYLSRWSQHNRWNLVSNTKTKENGLKIQRPLTCIHLLVTMLCPAPPLSHVSLLPLQSVGRRAWPVISLIHGSLAMLPDPLRYSSALCLFFVILCYAVVQENICQELRNKKQSRWTSHAEVLRINASRNVHEFGDNVHWTVKPWFGSQPTTQTWIIMKWMLFEV